MSCISKIRYMTIYHKIISENISSSHFYKIQRNLSTSGSSFTHCSTNLHNASLGRTTHNNFEEHPTSMDNSTKSKQTFSADEVNKFRKMSDEWWKPDGQLQTLHSMNMLRVPLVRDGLLATLPVDQCVKEGPKPLQGLRILDVGCGGGLLSEPLARLGAHVTGLDAAEEGIEAAKLHSNKDPRLAANLTYICTSIEDHVASLNEPYDAVVASEVLEHVASVDVFLERCCDAIKPGGSLFITCMDRTVQSYLGAIVLAEYVLGLLPRGTHDWKKFVPVQDLKSKLDDRSFHTRLVHGMFYNPVSGHWCWVRDSAVNYALHAVKDEDLLRSTDAVDATNVV